MADETPLRSWQALTAAAVLGTGRGVTPELPERGEIGRFCAALPRPSAETRLLHAAGVLAIHTAAGTRAKRRVGVSVEACSGAEVPSVSARSGAHLRQILETNQLSILVDWCRAAARAGKRAADETLPTLLTTLQRHIHQPWAEEVAKVLGVRGQWLASRNPTWLVVAADFGQLDTAWQDASQAERVRIMRIMRRMDPARARGVAEHTLNDAGADERAALLATFEVGLSADDESFLQTRLDDASKGVRASAAGLLACLPESKLCSRMADRARQLVQIEKQRKLLRGKQFALTATLPEATKEMTRDGVENRKQGSMGNKAWMLAQIVGATPLAIWHENCGASSAEILEAADASEWREALFLGWSMAAGRQRDAAWSESLLQFVLDSKAAPSLPPEDIALLVGALSPKQRENLLQPPLKSHKGRGGNLTQSAAWTMLLACEHEWSDAFTKITLGAIRAHVDSLGSNWDPSLQPQCAALIAVYASPTAAEVALRDWPASNDDWTPATKRWADELVRLIQFRREYLKELSP